MRKIYIILIILSISASAVAQNEGRYWYFGFNAGLDFSTSPPTALSDGQLYTFEGCSTISDDLGNLLFYSDGTTVWSANHTVMPNGTGLAGDSSSAQQLIVRNRYTPNLFFVVTVSSSSGLQYSIVDMRLNNGLGDIVPGRKNLQLNSNTHEKVTAYINSNMPVNWVLTFNNGTYYAYRMSGGIIDPNQPVVSIIPATAVLTDLRGMLKISPDGTKIINTSVGVTFNNSNGAVLADFDAVTGIVSNGIRLTNPTNITSNYGAEFSPDSRLLYLDANSTSGGNGCQTTSLREIFQYNIFGAAGWNDNPVALGGLTGPGSSRAALQLGPDGKIYYARACQPWLGAIMNPTVIGTGANYVEDAVALATGTTSREGLPNIASQSYNFTYNEILGNVKLDNDLNGCTPSDINFPNTLFSVNAAGFNSVAFSGNDGNYTRRIPNGQFTVVPRPENPSYWNFSPPSVTVNFPTQTSPQTQDFCVTANGSVQDLEVVVVPLELARPGFVTDYKVIVKNKGNVTTSGTVSLDFEEDFMTLFSTTPTAGNTPSNRLNWSFSNLQPFQMEEFLFYMTLNTPTQATNALNGGDRLLFTGNVSVLTGTDAMLTDNTMTLDQLVVNSYDPNDKTCLEGETIEPSQVGEYVHYMIRFENTGTASAVNVVVKDVIDTAKFNINTLVPLGGSHDYYIRIREGNEVEFIHEDINLDFNDATNDGYVLFKIKTLSSLVAGDTFDNEAEIYFDFNFPIITNNESVLVQSTASIAETTDASISLYPNPANNLVNVTAAQAIKQATVIDTTGRLVSSTVFVNRATSQQLDITDLNTGVYFVKVQSELGVKVVKVVKE